MDYDGVIGVPISFLMFHCPTQFEIVGWSRHNDLDMDGGYWLGGCNDATINGKLVYRRILIRHKAKNADTSTDNGTEVANIITDNTPSEVVEEKKPFFKRFKVVLNKIGCALLSLITFFTIS
jgi:hypothetical protein